MRKPFWLWPMAMLIPGCWSLEPWLPQEFPRERLFSRTSWPYPDNAVYLRWYEFPLPMDQPRSLDDLWQQTDEQIVSPEFRPLLRANGLRLGLFTGRLPPSLRQHLSQTNTAPQVLSLLLQSGKEHFQAIGHKHNFLACPVHCSGECSVAEFADAQLGISLQARYDNNGVHLSITPSVRHRQAPSAKLLWAEPTPWPLITGETETRFAFLTITATLSPKDLLIISAARPQEPSLGTALFVDAQTKQVRVLVVRHLANTNRPASNQDYNSLFPNPANIFAQDENLDSHHVEGSEM